MTRAEALAGMVELVLRQMPADQREEIINDPDMLQAIVVEIEQLAQETCEGARLNGMTLDAYLQAYARCLSGPTGNA